MAKKKGGASVGKRSGGAAHLTTAAKDASLDEAAADTVIQVINRRIRAARKKLLKIGAIEEARAEGKEINDDQARTLESRIQVNAILEELVRVEPLVEKALKKEIEVAVATALEEANKKSDEGDGTEEADAREDENEDESTVGSVSQANEEVKTEEAGQLLDLFYVSQVFGLGGTEADFEGFLSEGHTIEDIPVTRQQLQKLANLGKSLFTKSAHDGLTHQEALERCRSMAFGFLRTPGAHVDEETTVAEMMELINQIKSSTFFQSMVIEPTPPAPQPDPIAPDISAHVEQIAADSIPQINPAIQHPPSAASGGANLGAEPQGIDATQHISNEGSLDCSPEMPLGHLQPQAPAAASGLGLFLPLDSLPRKPAASPQTVPLSSNLQSQTRATPAAGLNMQNIPGNMYSTDYSGGHPQQQAAPSVPVVMESLTGAKVSPGDEEMQTERNITPPHAESVLHANDARQVRAEDKPVRGVHEQSVNLSQTPKPSPDNVNELDQRPRGPGRRPRGGDSSHGGSGPPTGSHQFHNGGSGQGANGGGAYNSGGRGHSGRGGGNWHSHRSGHGEGRGRGRGRSGGSHYGNWDSGNSLGGRGQSANGFPSRGSGRGNRGGYKGGRGGSGGPWRQSSQHSQPAQNM